MFLKIALTSLLCILTLTKISMGTRSSKFQYKKKKEEEIYIYIYIYYEKTDNFIKIKINLVHSVPKPTQ